MECITWRVKVDNKKEPMKIIPIGDVHAGTVFCAKEKFEKAKLEINKKYADKEFIVKSAHIVASTADAIMMAYAQLGPIGGAIAAAMLGVAGLAQLGAANSEREKVKG